MRRKIKCVTVFCGSSSGNLNKFEAEAYQLGAVLAKKGISLVYGGAKIGLMGAVARGVLDHFGEVIGVIPSFLRSVEIAHQGLKELIIVDSMHQRKAKMNELSDGAIALPGGFGTLDELFEMLTWGQLGLHQKPVGLLNTAGYYDDLIAMLHKMVDKEFLKNENRRMLLTDSSIETLLSRMETYSPPLVGKWIHRNEPR